MRFINTTSNRNPQALPLLYLIALCNIAVVQIFVWSMKTGRLLDVLSGHEGPVHGLTFSPTNVSCFFTFIRME